MDAPQPQARLEVRPAREADAAALRDIFNEAVLDGLATFDTEPRSLEEQRRMLAETAQDSLRAVLVAELGSWVLGWALLERVGAQPALAGVGEVSLYVLRSFRKHGVGKQLMRAAQQEAARRGFRKLIGYVLAENTDSLRLCRSTAFREAGRFHQHALRDAQFRDVVLVEYLIPR